MSIGTTEKQLGSLRSTVVEVREHEDLLCARRITEIPSNMQMRIAYNANSQEEYIGYAPRGLSASSTGWLLQKLTYDVSNRLSLRQIAYDSWDNRAGGDYS
jgi:hypothetical protein